MKLVSCWKSVVLLLCIFLFLFITNACLGVSHSGESVSTIINTELPITENQSTESMEEELLFFEKNNEIICQIVIPANANAITRLAGEELQQALYEKYQVEIPLVSDQDKEIEVEILLGAAARDECWDFCRDIKRNSYRYGVVKKKVIIGGDHDVALRYAIRSFAECVVGDDKGNVFIMNTLDVQKEVMPIRVSCVGDSITEGYGASTVNNYYPAILSRLLGDGYRVSNFGYGGSTLNPQSPIGIPYVNTKKYEQSIKADADIVIIMLGTNDACMNREWPERADLVRNSLRELISIYQELPSKPIVMIATSPVRLDVAYLNTCIEKNIVPMQIEIAKDYALTVIPIHEYTKDFTQADYMDKLHPNDVGYKKIALKMMEAICDILPER